MMRAFKMLVLAFVLALVAGAAWAAEAAAPAAAEAEAPKNFKVGDIVTSDLKVMDAEGKPVELAKVTGGKKIISFMNTACSACAAELSMLDKFCKKNAGIADFVVVASDMGKFDVVKRFKSDNRFAGTWLHDPEFRVPPRFGFNYAPAFVVLDAGGKVLLAKGGFMLGQDAKYEEELFSILK